MSDTTPAAAAMAEPGDTPPADPAGGAIAWLDGAPAELVGYVRNKGWKTPGELAEGYRQLEKHLGGAGEKLVLPKDEKDGEGWGRVWKALGRPDKAEDYKLAVPDGFDGEFAKAMAPKLHELGITARQAEGLAAAYNELAKGQALSAERELAASGQREMQALRTEWGPDYDGKLELARRGLRSFFAGLPDAALAQLETITGTAALMRGFARIGELTREDEAPGGDGGGPVGAKAQIERLKQDESFMKDYLDGSRPGHKAAVERMTELTKRAWS